MKKIHFIGIKGVGMTPLAIMAKQAGWQVSGCDVDEAFITDDILKKAHIPILTGFSKEHIVDSDIVIATGAHGGWDNPETSQAKKNGVLLMQGEAVGRAMDGLFSPVSVGISVTGCHGKTTTTALIATILQRSGLDPSYVIGTSEIPSLPEKLPGHCGSGGYMIAEADEYANEPLYDKKAKFLYQDPDIGVITNIEFDHPDIYKNIQEVKDVYKKFVENIGKGTLIVNGDDENIHDIIKDFSGKLLFFGYRKYPGSQGIMIDPVSHEFVSYGPKGDKTESYTFRAFGEHNLRNAAAAILVSRSLGLQDQSIRVGLAEFNGTKRRMEFKGTTSGGALVYDDYAHHPTEITTTLQGLRKEYPHYKIVLIFQPHTYSRTKLLFDQFIDSFKNADLVLVTNIFPSAREAFDPTISSEKLVKAASKETTIFLPEMNDVVQYIDKTPHLFSKQTIIILMGAGDVYKIANELVQNKKPLYE